MNCPKCNCFCPEGTIVCPCGHRFAPQPEPAAPEKPLEPILPPVRSLSAATFWALRIGLLFSLVLAVLSFLWRDRLPDPAQILPSLLEEPLQTEDGIPEPFSVTVKKLTYRVVPLYRYELSGLVVSEHRSDSWLDRAHERWQDYLNIKDICVIWGDNIQSGVYRRASFQNRDFTCFCQFSDARDAALFSPRQLANNHLLSADPVLQDRIRSVRPGDQVRFEGYLVRYRLLPNGSIRNTSTVRDDRGSGACETVYVNEFSVLRRANRFWRTAFPISLLLSGALALGLLLL